MRVRTWCRRLLIAFLIAAVAIVLLSLFEISLAALRQPIERLVQEQSGLHLRLDGRLSLRLGWRTEVHATDVSLAPANDSNAILIQARSLRAQPRLLELLGGNIDLRLADVSGLVIPDCMELPRLAGAADDSGKTPRIGVDELELTDAEMRCGALPGDKPLEFRIREATGTGAMNRPIELRAVGGVSTLDIRASASGPSLNDLLADRAELPLRVELETDDSRLTASGTISTLLSDFTIVAATRASLANPQALLNAFNIEVPPLPAAALAGPARLTSRDVAVTNATGRLGENDLNELDVAVRWFGERIRTEVTARMDRLDVEPLLPANDGGRGTTAGTDPVSVALPALENFDGRLALEIGELDGVAVDVRGLDATTTVQDGRLDVELQTLTLAGATISGNGQLLTGEPCASVEAQLTADQVSLAPWSDALQLDQPLDGDVEQVQISGNSCGNTLDALLQGMAIRLRATGVDPRYGDWKIPGELRSAEVSAGWSEATRIRLRGVIEDENITARVDTAGLGTLLENSRWPVSIAVDGAGSRLRANGRVWTGPNLPGLALRTTVDVPRIGSLSNWFDIRRRSELPFEGRVDLRIDDRQIALNGIQARLGNSDLRGNLVTERDPDGAVIRATLRSSYLDLDQIGRAEAPPDAEPEAPPSDDKPEPDDFDLAVLGEWLELPVEFDLRADELRGLLLEAEAEAEAVELTGRIGEQRISDARIGLSLGETRLTGLLDADFSQGEADFAYEATIINIDIGKLVRELDIRDDIEARAGRVELAASTRGKSLLELAESARLDATLYEFDSVLDLPGIAREFDRDVGELHIGLAPDEPTIWNWNAFIDGVPVRNWLRTPSLKQTLDPQQPIPITLVSIAGRDILAAEIVLLPGSPGGLNADVEISGDLLETTTLDPEELKLPLPDYRLAGSLRANPESIVVSDIEFETRNSRINGRIDSVSGETRNQTSIRMTAPRIETNDFIQLAEEWRESLAPARANGDQESDSQPAQPDMFTVASDVIEELTEFDDFDVQIEIDQLYSNGVDLGTATARIVTDAQQIEVRPLRIAVPGGEVDGGFRIRRNADSVAAELGLQVEALDYSGLGKLIDADSQAAGLMYLETDLRATADTVAELPRNLEGEIELLVIPENIQAGILNVWAGNVILALLANTSEDERKRLNCLVAPFDAKDGVLEGRRPFLDSTDVVVRGRGNIDVGNQKIDMLFAPQAKRERFLSVKAPFEVKGAWNDVSIGPAPGSFATVIFRWSLSLFYVPFKWLTGERFPRDGLPTCFNATRWEMPENLEP